MTGSGMVANWEGCAQGVMGRPNGAMGWGRSGSKRASSCSLLDADVEAKERSGLSGSNQGVLGLKASRKTSLNACANLVSVSQRKDASFASLTCAEGKKVCGAM